MFQHTKHELSRLESPAKICKDHRALNQDLNLVLNVVCETIHEKAWLI